jgi:hypothetical protein
MISDRARMPADREVHADQKSRRRLADRRASSVRRFPVGRIAAWCRSRSAALPHHGGRRRPVQRGRDMVLRAPGNAQDNRHAASHRARLSRRKSTAAPLVQNRIERLVAQLDGGLVNHPPSLVRATTASESPRPKITQRFIYLSTKVTSAPRTGIASLKRGWR